LSASVTKDQLRTVGCELGLAFPVNTHHDQAVHTIQEVIRRVGTKGLSVNTLDVLRTLGIVIPDQPLDRAGDCLGVYFEATNPECKKCAAQYLCKQIQSSGAFSFRLKKFRPPISRRVEKTLSNMAMKVLEKARVSAYQKKCHQLAYQSLVDNLYERGFPHSKSRGKKKGDKFVLSKGEIMLTPWNVTCRVLVTKSPPGFAEKWGLRVANGLHMWVSEDITKTVEMVEDLIEGE